MKIYEVFKRAIFSDVRSTLNVTSNREEAFGIDKIPANSGEYYRIDVWEDSRLIQSWRYTNSMKWTVLWQREPLSPSHWILNDFDTVNNATTLTTFSDFSEAVKTRPSSSALARLYEVQGNVVKTTFQFHHEYQVWIVSPHSYGENE